MSKQLKKNTIYSFFLELFFKEKSFPFFIDRIKNELLDTVVFDKKNSTAIASIIDNCVIYDVPNYLKVYLCENPHYLKELIIKQYKGYLANLNTAHTADAYIVNQVGKARSSKLRRHQNRLDLCIAPDYKMYFGTIDAKEYTRLFEELKKMTALRFHQKNEHNFELPYLDYYQEIMLQMINQKKAAIYVIYDGERPINITLNFIDGQTMLHFNSCYDIAYAMFNLGHLNTIKHIRWCYEHQLKLFDMGRGDFLHKRQWINTTYYYEKHIIYNSKNIFSIVKAAIKAAKGQLLYRIIKALKKINFNLLYGKFIKEKYKLLHSKKKELQMRYECVNTCTFSDTKNLIQIDYTKEPYSHLLYYVHEFLHKNFETKKNCCVFLEPESKNVFIIKGENKSQKITVYPIKNA